MPYNVPAMCSLGIKSTALSNYKNVNYMNYTQKLKKGIVYWLKDYTAPKVFTGMIFECLVTDQKIPAHAKIKKSTETHLKDWKHEIYKPERFEL